MGTLRSLFHLFLSPGGLVVLGALDSSIFFFLPFGVDGVLVALVARHPQHFWAYPLVATAGSLAGAAVTYGVGRTAGEAGLARLTTRRALARVQKRVQGGAALTTAALALVPPPFPFTAFVLASGALQAPWRRFLAGLAAARLLRFGTETMLARRFGVRITAWLDAPLVEGVVIAFVLVAAAGTAFSVVRFSRSERAKRPASAVASTRACREPRPASRRFNR